MRVRRAVLAAGILAGAAACGGGSAAALHPAGSLSPPPVRAALPGQAGQRLARFRFPGAGSIDFTAPAPVGPAGRAVIGRRRNCALALWATVGVAGLAAAHGRQLDQAGLGAPHAA